MITTLHIKNIGIIDEININLNEGFNVLTGETGAGKSIIIKALDIVLGAKANKDVVLDKEIPCYIEAVFENSVKYMD